MKRFNILNVFILTAILLIGVSLSLPATCAVTLDDKPADPPPSTMPQLGVCVPCKILSVHDGDTLKVEVRFTADIRLLDCWAPEISGPQKEAGIRAKVNLQKLAEGQQGTVYVPLTSENIGKATSLSRVLGEVRVNGDSLSYLQVKGGFAGKTKEDEDKLFPVPQTK